MRSIGRRSIACVLFALALVGCKANRQARRECPTPATLGIDTRDMVDRAQQDEFDALVDVNAVAAGAEQLRKVSFEKGMRDRNPNVPYREKNVLALSGGGSFGAFTAGVLCGWTARGDRPTFDVVTGISTGALVAPFAFLGAEYDGPMKEFYTTLEAKDLYKMKPIRGLFGEALADNTRMAAKVDETLSPKLICEIAREHRNGRRLYIGTTAAESRQFVVWDIGAIANRGRPEEDKKLIKQILLGSSAIPGVFPPQHITVDVDGVCVTERHIDGGVSQSIFIHPPYVAPADRSADSNADLAGTNLYLVVAGKLYADLEKIKPLALSLVGKEISAMIYAQGRGDLQRIFTSSTLIGANYFLTAIPPEYPAPTSSMEFKLPVLTGLFKEGYRVACQGAWRRTPPGYGPGETSNFRGGTQLTYQVRGPVSRSDKSAKTVFGYPASGQGIPALPLVK